MRVKSIVSSILTKFYHVVKNDPAQIQLRFSYVQFSLFILLALDFILKYLFFKMGIGTLNEGVSFSLFSDSSLPFILHVTALIVLTTAYYLLSTKSKWVQNKSYLLLIILAGFGNFTDRAFYGGVVDYINLYFFKNNLSDIVIFVSSLLLVFNAFKKMGSQ